MRKQMSSKRRNVRLPAEWEPHDGTLMAWPHKDTDWAPILAEAQDNFARIIAAITQFEVVLLIVPVEADRSSILGMLENCDANISMVRMFAAQTNDTWARDFGPITVVDKVGHIPQLLDFGFNGWGLKFASNFDNQITSRLHHARYFRSQVSMRTPGIVLEGGSIESDGCGTILTTKQCLLEKNRNPHMSLSEIEDFILDEFGADRVLPLDFGFLLGDDTDSHIDTLARLCPDDTIAYVSCTDPEDPHYHELGMMRAQLGHYTTQDFRGKKIDYRLIPLPWPTAIYDEDDERLPATYANFYIVNGGVLVPTYAQPENDAAAIAAVQKAFPNHRIVGVDCCALIKQHGSLHCVTMQLPVGTLCR